MRYDWKWNRANNKSVLVLYKYGKDCTAGKKIGSIRACYPTHCSCGCGELAPGEESYPHFTGYVGGHLVGKFMTLVEAKIAVEKVLDISTKKPKKKKEPERVK